MAIPVIDYTFRFHTRGGHDITFHPSDLDEAAATKYYGFLNEAGGWLIMEVTTTTVRYLIGTTGYAAAWAARATATYLLYNEVFV